MTSVRQALRSHPGRVAPAVVGVVALAVYTKTLLPGMAFGDWGEMQTVPHVLGVAHPTGYPTYILLAWLAQLAPIGSIAFRANLLSAVLVAAALAGTTVILLRLGVRPIIAVAAALMLGAVRTVWAAATVSEVNPLHLLFVVLLLHRALVWQDERRPRDLVAGALLLGLAFGNHLLTVFVAPMLAVFVLWVGRREIRAKPWLLLAAATAGILGLGVYVYVPIAAAQSPPLPYNHPVTLDGFLWLVTGVQFRGQFSFLTGTGPAAFVNSLSGLWSLLASQATPFVPVLGVVGLALLVRGRAAFGLLCLGIALVTLYVWANYLRLEHYLLVPWLILVVGAGLAVETLARVVDGRRASAWIPSRASGVVVGVAAMAFAVALGATNWAASDRSADHSGDEYVDTVLASLPPDAAILSIWDESTPLWHARFVVGRRPDVLIVDDTNIVYDGWGTRERRIASLVCDRPTFILRLQDTDLRPTRAAFRLAPFIAVRVAQGEPSATVTRQIYRVEPLDPAGC